MSDAPDAHDAPATPAPESRPVTLIQARYELANLLIGELAKMVKAEAEHIDSLPLDALVARNDAAVRGMAAHEFGLELLGVQKRLRKMMDQPRILRPERSLKIVRS